MHFGENQLSRSLIGLSPLPTAHPPGFQPWWVRSSTRSYPRFNLAMGRSLRFGSRACDSNALFGLAFATASPHGLTSPHTTNSQAHSSKGTPSQHPKALLRRIVGNRFQVLFHSPPGVLFIFPSRYLSAIGHQEVFRLTGWSRQIHSKFHELAATREHATQHQHSFRVRDSHPLRSPIPRRSANHAAPCPDCQTWEKTRLTTPNTQPLTSITCIRFSLLRFRSPLLTESHLFSLPTGTEMFHFPAFPPHQLYIHQWATPHHECQVSPFGHPRITARLTAPRGLSQPPTSFIGS